MFVRKMPLKLLPYAAVTKSIFVEFYFNKKISCKRKGSYFFKLVYIPLVIVLLHPKQSSLFLHTRSCYVPKNIAKKYLYMRTQLHFSYSFQCCGRDPKSSVLFPRSFRSRTIRSSVNIDVPLVLLVIPSDSQPPGQYF